jgi:histidinol phosphatase-like PHP family hydrolase
VAIRDTEAVAAGRTNGVVADLLRDLATVQASKQSMWGYKRAAASIRNLDEPIERYLKPDGTLRKIPNVGPSSTRVVLEVLTTGRSDLVDAAIAASRQRAEIEKSRALRHHFLTRAQVRAVLDDGRLTGPSMHGYHGDLQMHSTWSDGSQELEDIVSAGIARGYSYCAVTDHSYGLRIAGGISLSEMQEQHAEIDELNARQDGRFRLLKGIEANIRADGSVDMEPEELRLLEVVVAAPHAVLRSPADQTDRMLRTVSTPGVNILGHPRGRMYGSRPGVSARWSEVFDAAARTEVAIEIDGDPARQDLDYDIARLAVAAGCFFALDSDAHSTSDLAYTETAIAHARLAAVPVERIVNYWPVERLLEWTARSWSR